MKMKEKIRHASFDGTNLNVVKQTPQDVKAVAVIVHGLAEHLGRYDELASVLLARKFAVYRFDHRGHGHSAGQRAYYGNYNETVEDVRSVAELAKAEQPQAPLFVVGHSMGGFATACFATKYPAAAQGIVLSGALTRDNKKLIQGTCDMYGNAEYMANALAHLVCTDAEVVKAYNDDPLVLKDISLRLFHEIGKGVSWLKENSRTFVAPTLILHGGADKIVWAKDSRDFYDDIASMDKELKIYAGLYHEILNEPAKVVIMNEIADWIEKRL